MSAGRGLRTGGGVEEEGAACKKVTVLVIIGKGGGEGGERFLSVCSGCCGGSLTYKFEQQGRGRKVVWGITR